jgi:hypothetical protein
MITARPATRTGTAPRSGRSRPPGHARQERGQEHNARQPVHAPSGAGGDRRHRRLERRRTVREEIIVLSVLAMALIITVVVLALQWLDSTPSVASSLTRMPLPIASGGLL